MSTPLIVIAIVFSIVAIVLYLSIRKLEVVVGYLGAKQDIQTDVFKGIILVLGGDAEHKDVKDLKEQFEESAKEILDEQPRKS